MGMVAARHLAFPHMRLEGMRPEDRPVMFASSHAHYSVRRAAMVC